MRHLSFLTSNHRPIDLSWGMKEDKSIEVDWQLLREEAREFNSDPIDRRLGGAFCLMIWKLINGDIDP